MVLMMNAVTSRNYKHVYEMNNTRVWASAVLMFGGVAVAIVGGCFLIGVMNVVADPFCIRYGPRGSTYSPIQLSEAEQTFMRILYLLAFTSFGAATALIWMAVKRLARLF